MSMRSRSLAVALGVAGLTFWVAYSYFALLDVPAFLVEGGATSLHPAFFMIYGYLTLVVGVFLGSAYRELKRRQAAGRASVKIGAVAAGVVRSVDFWLGMFASPVVYVILLQAIDLENLTLQGIVGITLVGLQNGFVCNTIADGLLQGRGAPDVSTAQPGT